MKNFEANGTEYVLEPCTAICGADLGDESKRQEALFVSSENGGEKFEFVVFGWNMPEAAESFLEMCEDFNAWESDWEIVHTSRPLTVSRPCGKIE